MLDALNHCATVAVGLDVNVAGKCTLKNDHYFQLCAELKRIYAGLLVRKRTDISWSYRFNYEIARQRI